MLYVLPYGQMSLWGMLNCPTCNNFIIKVYTTLFIFASIVFISIYYSDTVVQKRVRAEARVGPHNKDIISIFYGCLLGDSHAERRKEGNGTRLSFSQESNRQQYLLWLHSIIASLGYCNSTTPKIQSRIGNKGVIRYILRFHTFSYSSLNWLHDAWYGPSGKRVPENIDEYLTPLAIAI